MKKSREKVRKKSRREKISKIIFRDERKKSSFRLQLFLVRKNQDLRIKQNKNALSSDWVASSAIVQDTSLRLVDGGKFSE